MTRSEGGGIDLTGVERAEYGFPGPLRDRLVSAILNGEKT